MNNVHSELKELIIIKTYDNVYRINYNEAPYNNFLDSIGIKHLNDLSLDYNLNNNYIGARFKIKLEEYNKKCRSIQIHRYNFFNIHQMFIENGDYYLIVSETYDYNIMKSRMNAPHTSKNYFFNTRTFKCTCEHYKIRKKCKHKGIYQTNLNYIRYYFILILINNTNMSICEASDIYSIISA